MMNFKQIVESYKQRNGDISQASLAAMLGWSTSTVSQLMNDKYAGAVEDLTGHAMRVLLGPAFASDNSSDSFSEYSVKSDVYIRTESFSKTFDLLDDLNEPESSLTASIGLITGPAGRGKTTACKVWAAEHPGAIYCLYMGYTCSALFRRIAQLLVGRSYNSYARNIELIEECTRVSRRVLIIDEADRMPRTLVDNLRTLNEEALLPIVLVGEPTLEDMAAKMDRLGSRIRKPRISFQKLDYVSLQALYAEAAGIDLDATLAMELLKKADYDFRIAANDMQMMVKFLNVNRLTKVTAAVIKEAFR